MQRSKRRFLAAGVGLALAAGLLAAAPTAAATAGYPVVGAFAGTTADQWDAANSAIGPLRIRRSFDQFFATPGNENWRVVANVSQFYSVRPPNNDIAGAANGLYDDGYYQVCHDLPSGSRFTSIHEPENEATASQMLAMYQHLVPLCHKAAADAGHSIYFWYVAMAFQWDGSHNVTDGTIPTWLKVASVVDRIGVDVYSAKWNGFHDLSSAPDFQRWFTKLAVPSGKPWGVVERGVSSEKGDQARADVLAADWRYLTGMTSNVAKTYMYWDRSQGTVAKDWHLPPGSASAAQMATIAADGG